MAKISVIYGSTTGNTANAAVQIAQLLGDDASAVDVKDVSAAAFTEPDVLVLGASTWGEGDLQDDWAVAIDTLKAASLAGKKVAVFGFGDQESYSDTFVDAMRDLYDAALEAGATVVGSTSNDGYVYDGSRAVVEGRFVGLVLDEENQSDLSGSRIENWVGQLKSELGIS
jgi:flavodoxin I